mgnify:CR=1 FL=1
MPIYQINEISATLKVGVWKITETADVLLNQLMLLGKLLRGIHCQVRCIRQSMLQRWRMIHLYTVVPFFRFVRSV